jgi:hypothetical protein
MRLVDLQPRWLLLEGQRVAIMFRCPHCSSATPGIWLTCFFRAIGTIPQLPYDYAVEELRGSRGIRALFYEALREMGHPNPVDAAYSEIVSCEPNCAWKRTSDDFASMSITPSIDASRSGHWHGFVTNGEIR